MMRALRRPAWWPLLAVFAWFVATIAVRPFAVPDEGRYSSVAWGMLTSGDWLVPRLDGLPYFHKPPLFYWITAFVMRWMGPVEWAARIAPLLGAMAGATALYLFARRWRGERFARLALAALATQILVFIGAQFANLDMLVAGCITVTVLAFAHAALRQDEGERSQAALSAGYLFAALGVLAKGLIGIVLPGAVIVLWLLLGRRWRTLASLLWWPGIVLFLLVAGPWFVLMQREFAQFAWYFFYVQHFARFAGSGFNNKQPVVFYPVVLLVLAFPWSLWIFRGLRRAGADAADSAGRTLRRLAWTWLLVVTVFFSLPQSKLVGYIFPVGFPLAFLAAAAFVRTPEPSRRAQAWWRASVGFAAVACIAAVAYGAVGPYHSSRALGLALRQARPEDRVVFVRQYPFDVPVYARLRRPVVVLDDWSEARSGKHDDWRKELADAAAFEPSAGQAILLPPADAPRALCTGETTWVVGEEKVLQELPMLAGASVVATQGSVRLVRLDAARGDAHRAGCPVPNGVQLGME